MLSARKKKEHHRHPHARKTKQKQIKSNQTAIGKGSTSALIIAFPVLIQKLNCELSTMMWILLSVFLSVSCIVGMAGKL
jgi:hypothetical protein